MAAPWEKYANPASRYGPDPTKVRQEQRAEEDQRLQREAAARAASAQERANQNNSQANDLAERKFQYEQRRRNDAPLTAKDRADAIVEYNKAIQLRSTIDDLVEKFRAGPGSTSGVYGAGDFFPTQDNSAFDSAANKLRGSVKAAQGFTGGEGNTMGEVKMNIGPFIPSSWEYDQTTKDKLDELYNQSDNAVERAVALLGGVPDQYGNVTQQPASKAVRLPFEGDVPQQRDDDPMAAIGGQPPQGADKSSVYLGDAPAQQPGSFAPRGATSRTIDNPALAGVNDTLGKMIAQGATRDQIIAFAASKGVVLGPDVKFGNETPVGRAWLKQNPGKPYPVNVDDMSVPMSGFEQFRNDAPQTMAGTAAATALNAGGMGIPQMLAGGEGLDYLRSQNPGSAFVGDVAGVIGGTSMIGKIGSEATKRIAPSLLTRGGKKGMFGRQMLTDASYGAGYGATTEGDPLTGAATAALGSGLGMGIGKGIGKTFEGVTDPAVQYLTERGIPLSLGETLGTNSMIGRQMQRMESVPILGDMMSARRGEARDAVFNAALGDAVAPSGQGISGQGVDALSSAQGIKNQAYKDAYTGINAPVDQQYLKDVAPFIRTGRNIYGDMGGEFDSVVKGELRPLFGPNRALDGESTQQFGQTIGDFASDFGGRGTAYGQKAANNMRGIGDATQDLVDRTNPGVVPKIRAANQINASLTPIENAMITANGKTPTPLQLQRAITSNTKKFGGRATAARGDNVPDVVRYAAENAPNIGNSGTADRLAGILPFILPTTLGGSAVGMETFSDSPGTTGLLATLAAMSTKTGQKALQKALTSRPKSVRKAGGIFGGRKAQRAIAGGITAPLLID